MKEKFSLIITKIFALLQTAISWILIYFSPTFGMVMCIGFFVSVDFVTGILAARKLGEPITSSKMRLTIGKFAAYGIGVLTAHVMERHFIPDFPAMKVVAGLISYIEVKSLNENIEKITGHNIFKSVLGKFNPNKNGN